jgi:hypothetical protein
MENIGTEKTVISCDYREIEDLINRYYGKEQGFNDSYEIPCLEEMCNDEDWDISINKEELGEYDRKRITPDDRGRYRQWSTRIFLTDLCNRNIIKPGNYLISISW